MNWLMPDDARIKIRLFRNAEDFRVVKAGEVIFKEGEPGDEMYVIRNGQVQILVGKTVVATLEQDEVFGEMALLDNHPRSATAMAATDCELVCITSKRFLFLISQTPHFALQLMQMLAARLRHTNATLGPN